MRELRTEVVIVGSGAGGATVAKELSKQLKKVIIIEKGPSIKQVGSQRAALGFYDKHGLFSKSKEGIIIYRAIMTGGTTIVSCGNAIRSLENELKAKGIDLGEEFEEAEKELNVAPISDRLIGEGTKRIMGSANSLGFEMEPMVKFAGLDGCVSCGNCVLGCQKDKKWTTLRYLNQAKLNGVSLLTNTTVTEVLISNGRAIGVKGIGPRGKITVFADAVILAAGGIGTPIILQNSGITEAGNKLFVDLFNVTYGITKNFGLTREPCMAIVSHKFRDAGFILSPFVDSSLVLASMFQISKALCRKRILGIMTKIKDDYIGKVNRDGSIEKAVTANDLVKLNYGASIAKEILKKTGAYPDSIIVTKPRGAHPGGTAAIGEVVDENQQTRIKRLFVCDASVLPTSPGLPPILTIVALSKRFAKEFLRGRERREFKRLMKSLPVRIIIDDKEEAELLPLIASNISEDGIFVETMNLKEDFLCKIRAKSRKINLIVALPEWLKEVRLTADLVWEKRETFPLEKSYGMGMRFTEMAINERNKLSSYISEMSGF